MMHEQENINKRVLFIAYGFPPIAHAGTHRTLRFCRYLPRNGWIPTVITIREDNDIQNDYNLLKKIPKEVEIHRTNTIDVWRSIMKKMANEPEKKNGNKLGAFITRSKNTLRSVVLNMFSIPDHMLLWVPFAVAKGISLIRDETYDVIYTTSPPHSSHLIGMILSKICRKSWVADFRDPIMDNFCLQELSRLGIMVNKLLERLIARNADRVIVVSDYHCRMMRERYPSLKDKLTVINNGFDPDSFQKVEADRFDRFTILYSGSFYRTLTPDFFLQGLRKWVDSKDHFVRNNIQAIFYGSGDKRVKMLAKQLGLEDIVRAGGFIPQEKVIKKQKGADLLLLITGFDEKSRGVIPAKMYEYMATGRPVLAIIPEGDALSILRKYPTHHHVLDSDYESLARSLDTAYSDYLAKRQPPAEERNDDHLEESQFNIKVQVKDLVHVFNSAAQMN